MHRGMEDQASPRTPAFATTHWSIVLSAQGTDSSTVNEAMGSLFRIYQRPLSSYLLRMGSNSHDAEDLLQGFFQHILKSGALRVVDPRRGRLRAFLLGSLANFVRNDRERTRAAKRGGGCTLVRLDELPVEVAANMVSAVETPAELQFDREWAEALFDSALARLETEFCSEGKGIQFSALAPFLSRPPAPGEYDRTAAGLGMRTGLMPTLVSRMRRRFQELVRAEVAATVATGADVDAELSYLIDLLSQ